METRRDVFQAIADPTRREIIRVITEKNMTLNGVAELFDISRQAISNHVKILTECGLVIINPKGRERYCAINPETLKEVATWVEPYKKLWERRLDKLGGLLDELQTGN
ncbi:MAG TPA: metalloregulator ArsR/SmtB family transcription factor [Mucilaginibacter sp.]|nr:metalloregulator ArsR/SmtB family transcription factor [Mucilaginibacter sp.]